MLFVHATVLSRELRSKNFVVVVVEKNYVFKGVYEFHLE